MDEYTIEEFRRDVYDTLTPPHQAAEAARAVTAATTWDALQALLDDYHEALDNDWPLETIDPLVLNFVVPDWVWDHLCGKWAPVPTCSCCWRTGLRKSIGLRHRRGPPAEHKPLFSKQVAPRSLTFVSVRE